jgi:hypothetical protein
MTEKLKLPNGYIQDRQYFHSAPEGFGRYDGKPKTATTTTPAITPGMRSRIAPSHEFAHGAPLNDEPLQKNWEGKGNVPTHPGMVTTPARDDPHRGTHNPQLGNAVLKEAGRLGVPVGGYKR